MVDTKISCVLFFASLVACSTAVEEEQRTTTNPLNQDDMDDCAHGALPSTNAYCGRSAGTQSTLYQCRDGSWYAITDCANGCGKGLGQPDQCIPAPAADPEPPAVSPEPEPPAAVAPAPTPDPGPDPEPEPEQPAETGDACADGKLIPSMVFCGRSAGTENQLFHCVDRVWNYILGHDGDGNPIECSRGCETVGYGNDRCR
jgi:hypothetical protein